MVCYSCGNEVPDGSRFCTRCGAAQPEQPVQVEQPVQQEYVQPEYEQPVQQEYVQPEYAQPVQQEYVQPEYVQPMQQEIVPDNSEVKKKFTKSSHPVLAVLLSILFTSVVLVASIVTILHMVVDKTQIKDLVKSIDVTDVTIKEENGKEVDLAEFVYKELKKSGKKDIASVREIGKIMQESYVKDFVADKLSGYVDDIVNGTSKTKISSYDIKELLEVNVDRINRVLSKDISYNDIEEYVDKLEDKGTFEKTDMKSLLGKDMEVIGSIKMAFSMWILIAIWGVAAIFMILLFVIEKRKIKGLCTVSIDLIVAAAILAIGLLVLGIIGSAMGSDLLTTLVNYVNGKGYIVTAGLAGAGVLGLVIYFITTAVQKKKYC